MNFPWYGPAVFALVTMGAVGLLVIQFYDNAWQHRQETIAADFATMESAMTATLKSHVEFLNILAEDFSEAQVDRKTLSKRLDKFLQTHPEILSVALYDAAGNRKWKYPLSIIDPKAPGLMPDAMATAFTEMLNSEETTFSKAYVDPGGLSLVASLVPVVYELNLSHGLVCQVRLKQLLEVALKGTFFEKYGIRLVTSGGDVVADFADPSRDYSSLTKGGALVMAPDLELRLVRYGTPVSLPLLLLLFPYS